MSKSLRWIFLIIILIGCNGDRPQSAQRGVDKERIDYYNSLERFNYDRVITTEPNPVFTIISKIINVIAWILNTIFGYLMIAVLVVLLIWVLFRYVNQERLTQESATTEVLRVVDKNKISELDFSRLISKALAVNNYRLAIRYTFLNSLKGLSRNKLIRIKEGKTNYEYYHELPAALKPKYRQVLSVFEYVWYGEFDSSRAVYEQINTRAKELQELIKKPDA